ncbi:MAG: carboxypeptidase regulatory-like domain-containing protein [Pseudomonadota bacterium]
MAVDQDGDGYGVDVDCNDTVASIYPGAVEPAVGVDHDCDGRVVHSQYLANPTEVHGSVQVEVSGATRPVVGATVRLEGDSVYTASIATNRLGRYSLSGPAGTEVQVCASAPGFQRTCQPASLARDFEALPPLRLQAQDDHVVLHGTVALSDGNVPHVDQRAFGIEAHSTVEIRAGANRRFMRTDLSGGFVASVPTATRQATVVGRHGPHETSTSVAIDQRAQGKTAPALALVLDNHRPKVTLVEVLADGENVAHVAAGSTVQVNLEIIEPDGHPPKLEFRAGQGTRMGPLDIVAPTSADQPYRVFFDWTLPAYEATFQLPILVHDDRGGHAVERATVSTHPPPPAAKGLGRVVDPTGTPVADAEVRINGVSVRTDADGTFELTADAAERYVLSISKDGYAPQTHVHHGALTYVDYPLRRARTLTVNAGEDIDIADHTEVRLSATALVTSEGEAPTFPITVEASGHRRDDGSRPAPGPMLSDAARLFQFGGIHVAFRDAEGRALTLAEGRKATVRVPIASDDLARAADQAPVWHFDEDVGHWQQSGIANREGNHYEFEVAHFSSVVVADEKFRDQSTCVVISPPLKPPGTPISPQSPTLPFEIHFTHGGQDYVVSVHYFDRAVGIPTDQDIEVRTTNGFENYANYPYKALPGWTTKARTPSAAVAWEDQQQSQGEPLVGPCLAVKTAFTPPAHQNPDNFLEYVNHETDQTGSDAFARYYYLLTDQAPSDPKTGPAGLVGFTVDEDDPKFLVESGQTDPPGNIAPASDAHEARWIAPGDMLSGFGQSTPVSSLVLKIEDKRLILEPKAACDSLRPGDILLFSEDPATRDASLGGYLLATDKQCATVKGYACSGGDGCLLTTIQSSTRVTLKEPDNQVAGVWARMETRRVVSVEGSRIELDEPFHHPVDRLFVLNNRSTLSAWLQRNCFTGSDPQCQGSIGPDAQAKYQNEFDLNFGRWMFMKTLPDDSVAFIVFNYRNIRRFPDESPLDTPSWPGLLAAVTMEHRRPLTNASTEITTFGAYDSSGARFVDPPLDGSKNVHFVPHICLSCHGGQPGHMDRDGNLHTTNFIPFDPESYGYRDLVDGHAVESEEAMRTMNQAICRHTNPSPGTRTFVAGMVGQPERDCAPGRSLTGVFRAGVVPMGWEGDTRPGGPTKQQLYTEVFAPSCRLCHVTREGPIAFRSYEEFKQYGAGYVACNPPYIMPQAERTYYNFWLGSPEAPRQLVASGLAQESSACGIHAEHE